VSTIVTLLHVQLQKLDTLLNQQEVLMSTVADVTTHLGHLDANIATVSSDVSSILQHVKDLQAQVNAGGAATAADLDAVVARLSGAESALQALHTSTLPPTPPTP
jgi:ABC-type transporter Mla subunit MlaD